MKNWHAGRVSESFTLSLPPPDGWERFAPTALDSQVGRSIRVRDQRSSDFVWGTVTEAKIAEDGHALLTIEIADGQIPWPLVPEGSTYSLTGWHDIRF